MKGGDGRRGGGGRRRLEDGTRMGTGDRMILLESVGDERVKDALLVAKGQDCVALQRLREAKDFFRFFLFWAAARSGAAVAAV